MNKGKVFVKRLGHMDIFSVASSAGVNNPEKSIPRPRGLGLTVVILGAQKNVGGVE